MGGLKPSAEKASAARRKKEKAARKLAQKQAAAAKNDAAAAAAAQAAQLAALENIATSEAPAVQVPDIVIPELPEPERMPSEVDAGTRKARNRIAARKRGGGGRMSTILTG